MNRKAVIISLTFVLALLTPFNKIKAAGTMDDKKDYPYIVYERAYDYTDAYKAKYGYTYVGDVYSREAYYSKYSQFCFYYSKNTVNDAEIIEYVEKGPGGVTDYTQLFDLSWYCDNPAIPSLNGYGNRSMYGPTKDNDVEFLTSHEYKYYHTDVYAPIFRNKEAAFKYLNTGKTTPEDIYYLPSGFTLNEDGTISGSHTKIFQETHDEKIPMPEKVWYELDMIRQNPKVCWQFSPKADTNDLYVEIYYKTGGSFKTSIFGSKKTFIMDTYSNLKTDYEAEYELLYLCKNRLGFCEKEGIHNQKGVWFKQKYVDEKDCIAHPYDVVNKYLVKKGLAKTEMEVQQLATTGMEYRFRFYKYYDSKKLCSNWISIRSLGNQKFTSWENEFTKKPDEESDRKPDSIYGNGTEEKDDIKDFDIGTQANTEKLNVLQSIKALQENVGQVPQVLAKLLGFLPMEIWAIMIAGIGLLVTVAIIKAAL